MGERSGTSDVLSLLVSALRAAALLPLPGAFRVVELLHRAGFELMVEAHETGADDACTEMMEAAHARSSMRSQPRKVGDALYEFPSPTLPSLTSEFSARVRRMCLAAADGAATRAANGYTEKGRGLPGMPHTSGHRGRERRWQCGTQAESS